MSTQFYNSTVTRPHWGSPPTVDICLNAWVYSKPLCVYVCVCKNSNQISLRELIKHLVIVVIEVIWLPINPVIQLTWQTPVLPQWRGSFCVLASANATLYWGFQRSYKSWGETGFHRDVLWHRDFPFILQGVRCFTICVCVYASQSFKLAQKHNR